MISSAAIGVTRAGGTGELYIDKTDDNYGLGENLTFHADAENNIALGANALNSTTGAALVNIGIGTDALTALTLGDGNIAIGYHAGRTMNISGDSILIGYQAGTAIAVDQTTTNGTVAIGKLALTALTTGANNVAVGYETLKSSADGDQNIAIGYQTLVNLTSSTRNTAIGHQAMGNPDATADGLADCVAIGWQAFLGNATDGTGTTTGANGTVAIGTSALKVLTSGAYNTAIGYLAGEDITVGSGNTLVGYRAGKDISHGSATCLGYAAGQTITTGSHNLMLGYGADVDTNSDNYQTRIGMNGALRYMTAQITMSDFTNAGTDNKAATGPLLKIPQYGFLNRVTCTVITTSGRTGVYNISLGTAIEAAGDTVAGQVEIIGAGASDLTGCVSRTQATDAAGDTNVDITAAKQVHIFEADLTAADDNGAWMANDMYLYVCHAGTGNASNATNAVVRLTAEYFGED